MALWGNNDNVSALGEGGAGVVSVNYTENDGSTPVSIAGTGTWTVTGTGSSFGTPGYAKTGDVIRIGMATDSGTYFGDAAIVGISSTTYLTIASTMGLSGAAIADTSYQISELPVYTVLQPWYSMDSDVNREDPSNQTVFIGAATTNVGIGTSVIALGKPNNTANYPAFALWGDNNIQIGDSIVNDSNNLTIVSIGTVMLTANHASPGAGYTVYVNGGLQALPGITLGGLVRIGTGGTGEGYVISSVGSTGITLGSTISQAITSGDGLMFENMYWAQVDSGVTAGISTDDELTIQRWIGGNHKKVFGVSGIGVSAALGTQYETGGGWVGVQTYYDTDGNYRVKKEILVAMSGIQTGNQPVYPTVS